MFRTRLTSDFDLEIPVVLAPMNHIADARLARAVTAAGGLGMLGGGYGDEAWFERQFDLAKDARVGCGLITWSMARQPGLLDLVLSRRLAGGIADGRGLAAALSLGPMVWWSVPGCWLRGRRRCTSERWHGHEDELRSNLADDTFRAEVTAEDLNGADIFVGEAVGLIHEVLPAATILRRMVLEAKDKLGHDATRIGRI